MVLGFKFSFETKWIIENAYLQQENDNEKERRWWNIIRLLRLQIFDFGSSNQTEKVDRSANETIKASRNDRGQIEGLYCDRSSKGGAQRSELNLLVRQSRFAVVAQAGEFAAAIVLVVNVVSHILQVLQVRAHDHVAQSNEITVLQVLHWKFASWLETTIKQQKQINSLTFCNAPRILSAANLTSIDLDDGIGADNRVWNTSA